MSRLPVLCQLLPSLLLPGCDLCVPAPSPRAAAREVKQQLVAAAARAEIESVTLGAELLRPAPGAPSWARALDGHHPQPRRAWKLFAEASAALEAERLDEELVLLEVKVTRRCDEWSAPDLKLVVERAGRPRLVLDGPEDRDTATLALLRAGIAKGETLSIRVYDRDLTSLERVGAAKLGYAGQLPLRVVEQDVIAELRALPRARVEALLAERLREVKDALARARAPEPRPLAVDLGLGQSPIPELRTLAHEAAALGGWSEPRLAALVAKLAKLEARFEAALKKALAPLPARGTSVEAAGSLEVRVAAFEPKTSRLSLELKNRGAEPVECMVPVSWIGKLTRFNLVDVEAASFPLKLASCTRPGATVAPGTRTLAIPPGETMTAVLELDPRQAAGRTPAKPAFLRIGDSAHEADARLLRLD